jgi:ribosome-binding protein aMBF1 (putative translation factor)
MRRASRLHGICPRNRVLEILGKRVQQLRTERHLESETLAAKVGIHLTTVLHITRSMNLLANRTVDGSLISVRPPCATTS